MIPVTPTSTLQVDDQTYQVEQMSEAIRARIALLDDWRQKQADLNSALTQVNYALQYMEQDLRALIMQERESATAAAKALGLLPSDAAATEQPAGE